MKYDDASWHTETVEAMDMPEDYSGVHIGLFLKWCFIQGWAGELWTVEEAPEDVQRVINGEMSGTAFLFQNCDGKFTDEDLNDKGNAFAKAYYGEDVLYLSDLDAFAGDMIFRASEEEYDFDGFSDMMEMAYRRMYAPKKTQSKPWWKFWW